MMSTWAPDLVPANITMQDPFNDPNGNATSPSGTSGRETLHLVAKVVYAIGIVGNAAAIVALRIREKRVRNRKHLLLLTSLAANDLVALVRNYYSC